jgi:hypothetical protein
VPHLRRGLIATRVGHRAKHDPDGSGTVRCRPPVQIECGPPALLYSYFAMTEAMGSEGDILKVAVFEAAHALGAHLAIHPDDRSNPNLFFQLVGPCVVDHALLDDAQKKLQDESRKNIIALGFPCEEIAALLRAVISSDKHLRECCVFPLGLAFLINKEIMPSVLSVLGEEHESQHLENLYAQFRKTVYEQGPFRRVAYTHIFNLAIEPEILQVGPRAILRAISSADIPTLLNEPSLGQSFLHPEASGNVFFVTEQEGVVDDNDYRWLSEQRMLAAELCTVLQYFKDGIVSLGYSGIHFNPPWVNLLRKPGLLFQGEIRRRVYKNGQDRYTVSNEEMETVRRWLAVLAHPKYKARMTDTTNDLRATIERAGTYYEASHDRMAVSERLIALAIAIEALFSPSDQGELRYRISQNAAMLLGRSFDERMPIFESVRKMYDLRSKLVHGSYDVAKYRNGELASEDLLREWGSYLRRSILAYVILLLRDYNSKKQILDLLFAACFDSERAVQLQTSSNEKLFINEFSTNPNQES